MRKITSRVGIGVAVLSIVSVVTLGVALNHPTVLPEASDVKVVSESNEKTSENSTETNVGPDLKDGETSSPTSTSVNTDKHQSPTVTVGSNNNNDNVTSTETPHQVPSYSSPHGNGTRMTSVINTYPYKDKCPQDNMSYLAYNSVVCQAVSYVSWKAEEKWGITNTLSSPVTTSTYLHIADYHIYVPKTGVYVYIDNTPASYTIAVLTSDKVDHVMWVESVNGDGSINVSEYSVNFPGIGCHYADFCAREGISATGLRFVHFE